MDDIVATDTLVPQGIELTTFAKKKKFVLWMCYKS